MASGTTSARSSGSTRSMHDSRAPPESPEEFMKRLITVVLVMALLLVGAPWVIGNVAEDRVDRGLDALVESAPTLRIVEKKYTRGWFRSGQEVTFDVLGGALRPFGAPSRFTVR